MKTGLLQILKDTSKELFTAGALLTASYFFSAPASAETPRLEKAELESAKSYVEEMPQAPKGNYEFLTLGDEKFAIAKLPKDQTLKIAHHINLEGKTADGSIKVEIPREIIFAERYFIPQNSLEELTKGKRVVLARSRDGIVYALVPLKKDPTFNSNSNTSQLTIDSDKDPKHQHENIGVVLEIEKNSSQQNPKEKDKPRRIIFDIAGIGSEKAIKIEMTDEFMRRILSPYLQEPSLNTQRYLFIDKKTMTTGSQRTPTSTTYSANGDLYAMIQGSLGKYSAPEEERKQEEAKKALQKKVRDTQEQIKKDAKEKLARERVEKDELANQKRLADKAEKQRLAEEKIKLAEERLAQEKMQREKVRQRQEEERRQRLEKKAEERKRLDEERKQREYEATHPTPIGARAIQ